jgi:hypothetical protein
MVPWVKLKILIFATLWGFFKDFSDFHELPKMSQV